MPLAMTAGHSAAKAALRSYTLSLRYRLRDTTVSVRELIPPWVRTDLMNSNNSAGAMPLDEFTEETMTILATDAEEVLVERVKPLRGNPGANEGAFVTKFNDMAHSADFGS